MAVFGSFRGGAIADSVKRVGISFPLQREKMLKFWSKIGGASNPPLDQTEKNCADREETQRKCVEQERVSFLTSLVV